MSAPFRHGGLYHVHVRDARGGGIGFSERGGRAAPSRRQVDRRQPCAHQPPPESIREKAPTLRRALREAGVPYACAACRIDGTWQGKPLTLHVDHMNGNWLDNRLEIVRFLCPNCHSQTDNYAGRGKASKGS
ncbi:hypothetical protein GCM10010149_40760 [Nonomuraea roseoviolacea subsp. roseoviolacea]